MKAPGIFSMMMLMTLAIFAYAEAAPRGNTGLFNRSAAAKTSCPLGSHYSSFYGECTRTFTQASFR